MTSAALGRAVRLARLDLSVVWFNSPGWRNAIVESVAADWRDLNSET